MTTTASVVSDGPARFGVVGGGRSINLAKAEQAVPDLLGALGRDPDAEHVRETPRRVAGALPELLTPEPFDLTTFDNDAGYDELFARDLQRPERLTTQIACWLQEYLQPRGAGVVLEADHLCTALRGGRVTGARTVTSAVRGLLRHDPRTRQEFFTLTAAPGSRRTGHPLD